MAQEELIKLFDAQQVRVVWDSEAEKYYFSVVDIIQVLTETDRPRKYWSDLKNKLFREGSEVSEKIGQLKMQSSHLAVQHTSPLHQTNCQSPKHPTNWII